MKGQDTKHLTSFRNSKLKVGEQILGHLDGWIGDPMGKGDKKQHNGQLIVTNERACFYRKGILGEVFETIPLSKITSAETLSRMGYRVLRLHTSHDELAFKTFEAQTLFDEIYEKVESSRHPAPWIASESIPDQIRKLSELYEAGIVTETEFSTKKSELPQRM